MLFQSGDDELMAKLARGDQSAFRALFDRHGARVLGYCCRFLGNLSKGEDLAQEIWMKVIKAAPHYRAEGKFPAWLISLTRNACLSEMRKHNHKFEAPEEDLEAHSDDQPTFEQQMEQRQDLERIKEQLDQLPEAQRVALTLMIVDDMTYEDIATEMDLSLSAVKSLIFRARQSLLAARKAES